MNFCVSASVPDIIKLNAFLNLSRTTSGVEDLIASEILNSMINEGDIINIDYSSGKEELSIKIQNKRESKTSKK